MLKINIYWHKCSCHNCDIRTTECEDRAILKQNSQYDYSGESGNACESGDDGEFRKFGDSGKPGEKFQQVT